VVPSCDNAALARSIPRVNLPTNTSFLVIMYRPKQQFASSHPWHDLNVGDKAPEEVHAVVEIPAKSKVKYELDKDTGMETN
jgi:hypothetical protein